MERRKQPAIKQETPRHGGGRMPLFLAPLLIIVCAVIAYANTFSSPLVFDDQSSIIDNRVIHDLSSFLSGAGYAYNPRRFIGYLSFALNYRFGALNVFGYHLVNLVIHIANGFLVYALASLAIKAASGDQGSGIRDQERLLPVPGPWPLIPLFAALLFVVHPGQTQAVTYIVQRLASLATLFYLAAVVCYARGRHEALDPLGPKGSGLWENNKAKPPRSPFTIHHSPILWYFLAVISGLLALKTKEIAVTLPLAVILYEFIFYGFSRKKLFILLVPLLLGAVLAVIGIAGSGRPLGELLSDVTEMSRQTTAISRMDYLITQFAVIATYLRLLVLPMGQNLDYDYPVYSSLAQAKPLLGLLLHSVLIGVAVVLWRKTVSRKKEAGSSSSRYSLLTAHYSLIAFGILWFYLTLSIESSLIPITDVIFEHRMYLPAFGFFLSVGILLAMASERVGQRKVLAAFGVVVLALLTATVMRNRDWRDETTLWSDVAAKSPEKFRPRINLAIAAYNAGDPARAVVESLNALNLDPGAAAAHTNLGASLKMTGKLHEAIEALNRAIELDPDYVTAYTNLGAVYEKLANTNKAETLYREALRRQPDLLVGKFNLAALLQRRGELDEAENLYKQVLVVTPHDIATLKNLGVLFISRGDHAAAAAVQTQVQKTAPDSIEAHTLKGDIALAREDVDEALKEYTAAISISPINPLLRMQYASLLEKKRRFGEALAAYSEAIRLDPSLAEAHNSIGVILGSRGMLSDATVFFQKAVELSPGTAEYRENLAKALSLSARKGP